MPPGQGLVLEWRRESYRWSALVVTVRLEVGKPVVVQEWTEAERRRSATNDRDECGLGGYRLEREAGWL